jgi:hypothetical protein
MNKDPGRKPAGYKDDVYGLLLQVPGGIRWGCEAKARSDELGEFDE